jgi:hypothetical protein
MVSDPVIMETLNDLTCVVCRPIVDNDNFQITIALTDAGSEGLAEI